MMPGTDRALYGAALWFACATGYNSAVAIRENVPGEPLGIHVRLSVPAGIVVGWGSAVAAPWPMPLAGLLAAHRLARTGGGSGPGLVCTGLGVAGIVGILIEPNTYKAKTWTPAVRRAVLLHVGACSALAATGIWQGHHARRVREEIRAV